MSYGSTPYDKKRYKESKRRRKQAMIAEQTGRILPFSTVRRRVIISVCLAAAALCIITGVYLVYLNADGDHSSVNDTNNASISNSDELLTVVNTANMLEEDYVPELENFGDYKVNALAKSDLELFMKEASDSNVELKINSAYISYQEQQEFYNKTLSQFLSNPDYTEVRAAAAAQKIVPKAGCSEAQTGLLVEFDISDDKTDAFIQRNCINYGFVQRYPKDKEDITKMDENKALYRYVGVDNAKKMRAYNMCLEEYSEYMLLQKNQ